MAVVVDYKHHEAHRTRAETILDILIHLPIL